MYLNGVFKIPEFILKFAYINLLWVCFSMLGFLIFGFFPATAAMFAVFRKWLMGDPDIPIFKTFWSYYKKDFLKSNLLGLILFVVGFALYIDYRFIQLSPEGSLQWTRYPLLMITIIYLMTLFYVFPVFVQFDNTVFQVIKNSFLIMIVSPLSTIMMIAGSIIIYFTMTTFPGLIPIFGGSLLSFVIMWSAYLAFARLNQKDQAAA